MPVTQVSICNSALIKCGSDTISAITQDARRAQLLNAVWDQVRDSVLRAHRWNFATRRVTLAPTSDTPEWGYDYEYDLPNDCLRFLTTDPDDIEYKIEADADGNASKIRTDETTLDILYIYQNTNLATWDSCFAEAMAWRLAAEIAYALTQSLALSDSCAKKYEMSLREARSMDGTEGTLTGIEADVWTNERL